MKRATDPAPINLDELIPGCTSQTWRDKKRFCELEGKNYAADGVGIERNPYHAGTWPHRWFNEAFMLHVDAYGEC